MGTKTYDPLWYADHYIKSATHTENHLEFTITPFDSIKRVAKEAFEIDIALSEDEFRNKLIFELTGTGRDGSIKKFVSAYKNGLSVSNFNCEVSKTEAIASILLPLAFYHWSKNKICYRISKQIRDKAICKRTIKICKNDQELFPDAAWIDFKNIDDGNGALFVFAKTDESTTIVFFSFKNKALTIEYAVLPLNETEDGVVAYPKDTDGAFFANIADLVFLKGSVTESEITKKTYKKPKDNEIKNKFSEIRLFEADL